MVDRRICPKCKDVGIIHYVHRKYIAKRENFLRDETKQRYVECIHPMKEGKRKICYVGADRMYQFSYSNIFKAIYKALGKLLINGNLSSKEIQIIIDKYKKHTVRKLEGNYDNNIDKVRKHIFHNNQPKVLKCDKCGKMGVEHDIWNPEYPYRVYRDVIHYGKKITRCFNGKVWFGGVISERQYQKSLKALVKELEILTNNKIITEDNIKSIIGEYIGYTEPECYLA